MERNIKTICLTSAALFASLILANCQSIAAQTQSRSTPGRAISPATSVARSSTYSKQDPFEKQAKERSERQGVPNFGAKKQPAFRLAPTDPVEKMRQTAEIQFNFQGEEWKEVIDWFAEQAKFSMNYRVPAPSGSFTYNKAGKLTVNESLDVIQAQLEVEGHYLVRNGETLILTNDTVGFPLTLVETITPDQLDFRAKYEVVRCVFTIPKSIEQTIVQDVSAMIEANIQRGFSAVYVQSAKYLYVREKVGNLLRIRDLINAAPQADKDIAVYRAKHIEPESLMTFIRQLMFIPANAYALPDQSLIVAIEPLGNKMFLKGTAERIKEFLKVAELVDVESTTDEVEFAKPFFKTYRVTVDPELAFKLANSFFDGEEGVKMDQDQDSGNLYFMGNEDQHQRLVEILGKIEVSGDDFRIVHVKNEDPDDITDKIEEALGIDLENTNGPKLVPDDYNNTILVSGTPNQLDTVEAMIKQLDSINPEDAGPRRNTAFLDMPSSEADRVIQALNDGRFQQYGRPNVLNIIVPEDRERIQRRLRAPQLERNDADSMNEFFPPEMEKNAPPANQGSSQKKVTIRTNGMHRGAMHTRIQDGSPFQEFSGPDSETQDSGAQQAGATSEESTTEDNVYKPAPEPKSVPGAPVEIRQTTTGILIKSDDLDAVEDLKYMIRNMVDDSGEVLRPTVLYLINRSVTEVKGLLETLCGIDGGGGAGGGGGLAGALGGVVSNAVGGQVGGALGGLLGGGGGGGGFGFADGGAIELEGDVTFKTDLRQNALFILGATTSDLDILLELIVTLDVDSAPLSHVHRARFIPVRFRDPEEIKMQLELHFSDLFKSQGGQPQGGGNAAAAQQAAIANAIKQLGGARGQGGGRAGSPQQEKPKAIIGVDMPSRSIVVTGPKFIYETCLQYVKAVDLPPKPLVEEKISTGGAPVEAMIKNLQQIFPKLVMADEEDAAAAGGATTGANGATTAARSANRAATPNAGAANAAALQNALRQFNRGGGGGGRGGGRGGGGGGRRGGR